MKKSILFLLSIFVVSALQAQTLKVPTKADAGKAQENIKAAASPAASQANIGSLIGQLTDNISDDALTDSFKKNKTGFVKNLANVNDAAGAASALQTLQGGLLPTAMDAGWGKVKDKWLKDTKVASSIKSVAGVTSTLESNIGDKFFKGSWANARPAWQAGLSALSK
jgi:uncharacterized protein YidB (DUF937 family)